MLNSLDIEGRPSDTRVVVAMSGGVNSSVTAALLAEGGYEVVGITLQLYDHGAATHRKGACCAGRDIHDARTVAERVGIPHYVLDYESRFKEAVIDRFAESYVAGETPVPCLECNQSIKFRDLLQTARDLGAKVLATGHYVASRALPGGGRALYRAREAERDQSYFLSATTRAQLDLLRFPLGERTKAETRELARRFGLTVADKQDSQDICFVPSGHYADVIERLRPGAAAPGEIVDLEGRVLGGHDGIIHFTVGQRRGLGIATGVPLYVVRLDAHSRRVVVGPREALRTSSIRLRDVNWLGAGTLEETLERRPEVYVKVRSTRPPQPAWLRGAAGGSVEVELIASEDGVSPGPGLRFLRRRRGPGARARWRHHRQHGGGADRKARASRQSGRGALIEPLTRLRWQNAMASQLDKEAVAKAYARWAPIYDLVFGAVFERGRKASIAAAERIGGRILEVGVGTGLSLPDYSWTNRLTGVDLSAPMLRRAKARAAEHRLTNVDGLAVMDAQRLGFQDGIFDVVVAQYVITAVPDPEATLDEFARVLKPGGEIVLVNHLGAEAGLRASFEQWFAPMARRLGWQPEFGWERLAQWAARHGGVRVVERRPMPPLGHFSLIRFARLSRVPSEPFVPAVG